MEIGQSGILASEMRSRRPGHRRLHRQNDDAATAKIQNLLIPTDGFATCGGPAVRDPDAIAVGLEEILDEDYLRHLTSEPEHLRLKFRTARATKA